MSDLKPISAAEFSSALLQETEEPLLLEASLIRGSISVVTRHIRRPLRITRCAFEGAFDLRNARFDATVEFIDCAFHQDFNSGDRRLSHTGYGGDISFEGSRFEGAALFVGMCCTGSGSFRRCTFSGNPPTDQEVSGYAVDFTGASFGKALGMGQAIFKRNASFNGMRCGFAGFFHDTRFESANGFDLIDFIASRFEISCELDHALFQCRASFHGMHCGWILSLNRTRFLASADFLCAVTAYLNAYGTDFGGVTGFRALTCHNKATFEPFPLGLSPDLAGRIAAGPVPDDLRTAIDPVLELSKDARIVGASGNWRILSLGDRTEYVLLPGRDIVVVQAATVFRGAVDFSHGVFTDLSLNGAKFLDSADLQHLSVERNLDYAVLVLNKALFRGIRFKAPAFGEDPVRRKSKSQSWRILTDAQDPANFSRDIYIALENCYRAGGACQDADDIYYEGCCAERRHAVRKDTAPYWTRVQWLRDSASKWLTGYGVRLGFSAAWIAGIISAEALVFYPEGALRPAAGPGQGAQVGVVAKPAGPLDRGCASLRFSVDNFVPLVKLHLADEWEAAGGWRRAYNALHSLLGWVLVPLFFGTFVDLLKKQQK